MSPEHRARLAWSRAGLLSNSCQFNAVVEGQYLAMFVDVPNVGKKRSVTSRVVSRIALDCLDALEDSVALLHQNVMRSIAQANDIGVRF